MHQHQAVHVSHSPAQVHHEPLHGLGLGGCDVLVVPEQHVRLDAAQRKEVAHGLEGPPAVGVDALLSGPDGVGGERGGRE